MGLSDTLGLPAAGLRQMVRGQTDALQPVHSSPVTEVQAPQQVDAPVATAAAANAEDPARQLVLQPLQSVAQAAQQAQATGPAPAQPPAVAGASLAQQLAEQEQVLQAWDWNGMWQGWLAGLDPASLQEEYRGSLPSEPGDSV